MNQHDLFHAIGSTDDAFLTEIQQPAKRRMPKHFGLIAAMLALILTACAPAAIQTFSALQNGSASQIDPETVNYNLSRGLETIIYEFKADIDISPDAPETIETIYMPAALKSCSQELTCEMNERWVTFRYEADSLEERISFAQIVFPESTRTGGEFVLGNFLDDTETEPVINQKTFGDVVVLEVIHESPAWSRDAGAYYWSQRTVFWSDGLYVYFMNLPGAWSEEQVAEMVGSLTQVEDLSEYHIVNQ